MYLYLYKLHILMPVSTLVSIGGFNGWPHVQWPTRPLPKEAPEAPQELCTGGP